MGGARKLDSGRFSVQTFALMPNHPPRHQPVRSSTSAADARIMDRLNANLKVRTTQARPPWHCSTHVNPPQIALILLRHAPRSRLRRAQNPAGLAALPPNSGGRFYSPGKAKLTQ